MPNYPTIAADNSSIGDTAWTNVNNIKVADGVFATCLDNTNGQSHYIVGTGFGFAIPNGSTINGIQVTVRAKSSSTSSVSLHTVELLKGGVIGGTNLGTTNYISTALTDYTFGGTSNLWGLTWTPDDINASNFGVAVSAFFASYQTAYIDSLAITITYTAPTGVNFAGATVTSVSGATVTHWSGTP